MKITTKFYGTMEVEDDKIIHFPNGIMGFEQYKEYALLYDEERETENSIFWLQSTEEETLALPIMNPFPLIKEYHPELEDAAIEEIGPVTPENIVLYTTITVPSDLTKMTMNLRAPIVINLTTKLGIQIIAENTEYPVKYPIYAIVEQNKEGGR